MGALYTKGATSEDARRQFEATFDLAALQEARGKLLEEMKKHIEDKSCGKGRSEYLYELAPRDFAEWLPKMKDPCREYPKL